MKQVLYLVNNLDDPAIARRVRMLELGKCSVTIAGFRRSDGPLPDMARRDALVIGKTADAKLADRLIQIAASFVDVWRRRTFFAGTTSILARNLEMVVLAIFIRSVAARGARITYECLDIHRIQVDTGIRGRAFRALEKHLTRKCDLLITSSPGFVREYFMPLLGTTASVILVENKVLIREGSIDRTSTARPPGPPWVAGWFGALRCRRSFEILRSLSNELGGQLLVLTAGRPARAVFPDFEALLPTAPHFRHLGSYQNPVDLAGLYAQVHFSWVIDFFEAGANSRWLLPNRIYEGCLFGTVPIAIAGTETARFLADHSIGVLLEEPLETSLGAFIRNLSPARYAALAAPVGDLPGDNWLHTHAECEALVRSL